MKGKFPNGLQAAMDRRAVGYTAFARIFDMNRQTVERYAKWQRKLTAPIAEKFAPELGVSPEELLLPDGGAVQRVPLLDKVQAGRLTASASQIPVEDVPLLAFADLGRGEFFALRVEGNSMDRISPEGSTIVVDRTDKQLVGGKPYVFSLRGGEATYKLWHPPTPAEPAYLEPHSWDNSNKPQFIKRMKDLFVVGRVLRSIIDLR